MIYRQRFKPAGKKGGYLFIAGCGMVGAAVAGTIVEAPALVSAGLAFAGSMAAPAGLIRAMIGRELYEVVTDPEKLAWRQTIASWDRTPITRDQPPPAPRSE